MLKTLIRIRLAAMKETVMRRNTGLKRRGGRGMRILIGLAFAYLALCLLMLIAGGRMLF